MRQRLAKTYAGVDGDIGPRNASRFGSSHPRGEGIVNVQQNIVIIGVGLHRGGRLNRMHQDDRHVVGRNQSRHLRIKAQGGHVIDPRRPRLQRRLRHGGFAGVNRQGQVQPALAQRCNHGGCAGDFFGHLHLDRAGPRAFAADVDDLGPCGHQSRLHHGGFGPQEQPAVRKAVGGDVQNAHDARLGHRQGAKVGPRD